MHVRLQLADARITLRRAQDEYDLITADAEHRITDAAGGPKGLGANAEDRARVLRVALMDDDAYREALQTLRDAQADVDRLAAEVEIAIDDDGCGIPEEERTKVFERFSRGSTASHSGSGLGLALVAQQAELYGGTASLVESPLGGARLLLRLPLTRARMDDAPF